MDIFKWKPTVPSSEIMKDNTANTSIKQDLAQRIEHQRKLAAYIRTSLWDEKMNCVREYWLWERRSTQNRKPEHYYMIKEF